MIPNFEVNFLAIIVVTILAQVIGFIWYGPLFSKPWMALSGISSESIDEAKQKGMNTTYGVGIVLAFIMAYVLAHFVRLTNSNNLIDGMMTGFWAWLGFEATTSLTNNLFSDKPVKLWMIQSGYWLVTLLMMGGILAMWQPVRFEAL